MMYTFNNETADSLRETQYFEMLGNQGIYHDGWTAQTTPIAAPWVGTAPEADTITGYMQRLGVPNGLHAVGYTSADIPALVEATLPQHRVTKLSPRPASEEDLARMFEDAMQAW